MAQRRLVTVVGATGAQGGAVVRSLIETSKYKIRALTRNANSEKAQKLKQLSNDIEIVTCDINQIDDVKNAFKDAWAIFALTDFWAQPDQPEVEIQQGTIMADVAAALRTPYYIFSTLEGSLKISGGKIKVPHIEQKAELREYIKKKHPTLKTIYIEPGFYMQNWTGFFKTPKLADGTVVFTAPVDEKTVLHMADIEDTGPVVREILNNPDKYVGQDICICGDAVRFGDLPKVFTKVTGIPAVSKRLTDQEFRSNLKWLSQFAQDDIVSMYQLLEEYDYYGREKDWKNGQKLTSLNTFEQWLRKSGWKGD